MNALFDLGVKETDRTDIVTALLTGIEGVTQISSNPAAADTLKINLGVPPSSGENRFGVIAGDTARLPERPPARRRRRRRRAARDRRVPPARGPGREEDPAR